MNNNTRTMHVHTRGVVRPSAMHEPVSCREALELVAFMAMLAVLLDVFNLHGPPPPVPPPLEVPEFVRVETAITPGPEPDNFTNGGVIPFEPFALHVVTSYSELVTLPAEKIRLPYDEECVPHLSPAQDPGAMPVMVDRGAMCAWTQWPYVCRPPPEPNSDQLTHFVVVELRHGYVSPPTCHGDVPGQPFMDGYAFRLSDWINPVHGCHHNPPHVSRTGHPIEEYDELISTLLSSYPTANGHFVVQTLPRILILLQKAPRTAKVLIQLGGVADKFIQLLIMQGLLTHERIVPYNGGHVYFGRRLWFADFTLQQYADFHTRCTLATVENYFDAAVDLVPPLPPPFPAGPYVVLIRRFPGGARSVSNEQEVVHALASHFGPAGTRVQVFESTAETAHGLLEEMRLFRGAALVVAPHGAGLFNMLWTRPGTPVLEFGYKTGMPWPYQYWDIARLTGRRYCAVLADGDYGSPMRVPIDQLKQVLRMCVGG